MISENPYKPYEGSLDNNEEMRLAYEQYQETLRQIEAGEFLVKEGSLVFRVVNGLKVGRSSGVVNKGDIEEKKYATPHPESVVRILESNDREQYYYDLSPHDSHQRVIVIKVINFEVPKPDITHGLSADKDQIIVDGEVMEVLTPNEFISKYIKEEEK